MTDQDKLLELTTNVVKAYLQSNRIPAGELARAIADVGSTIEKLSHGSRAIVAKKLMPAVDPKRTIFPNYIISLETGEGFRTLTRHLSSRGITPEQYRKKWNLPDNYPMVAPSYSAQRSELSKRLGFGGKRENKLMGKKGTAGGRKKASGAES